MNRPLVSISIISYDGSSDGTAAVILEYAEKYPERLVALVGGPNLGITGNSNRALKACKGKYIAFQGGDDVLLPGKISKQVEWMEADERRVLCGHDVEAFDSETGKRRYLWSEHFPMRSGKGAYPIVRDGFLYAATAVMVRASAIPLFGFDERLPIISDRKLWIDCLASGGYFGYVNGIYARYRRHANSITSHYSQILQDDKFVTLALVESRYPHLASGCKYCRASFFYGMGLTSLVTGDKIQARVHFTNAVRQLFHWKAYRALLLSFLPYKVIDLVLRGRDIPTPIVPTSK